MTGDNGTAEFAWRPPKTIQDLADSGCSDLIPELVAAFTSDVADRLKKARQAVASDDMALFRAQMHTMKGSAMQMGAAEMAALCRQIEETGATLSAAQYEAHLAAVTALFERTHRAMAAYLHQHS